MDTERIKDALFYWFGVPTCVGCGTRLSRDESVFCVVCAREYEQERNRNCSRCAQVLSRCVCPNRYLDRHRVHRLIKIARYRKGEQDRPQNRLVYSLKQEHRRDVIRFLAKEIAGAARAVTDTPQDWLVSCVPRRTGAVSHYGFDHAADLARAVAKELGAQYRSLLRSLAKRAQKEVERRQRCSNATFALLRPSLSIERARILLVDDVVTSGSSMGNAAMLLYGAGAKEVIGAAFCIAYPDEPQHLYADRHFAALVPPENS